MSTCWTFESPTYFCPFDNNDVPLWNPTSPKAQKIIDYWNLMDIQEIFQDENVPEAIILLNNGDAVLIQGHLKWELKAFIM